MSSRQPSCELWMPYRKSEQTLCKRPLVALHIGLNTLQRRKPLNSAARLSSQGLKRWPYVSAMQKGSLAALERRQRLKCAGVDPISETTQETVR